MNVLETLRELASKKSSSIEVSTCKPPTYVSVFYSQEEKPSEIIFIYRELKEVGNVVVDGANPNHGDGTPGSEGCDFDITGNPLEDPFEKVDFSLSITHNDQQVNMWHKSEENHLPLSLKDARSLINSLAVMRKGKSILGEPLDIWILTKPNSTSDIDFKKKRQDLLLCLRHSKAITDGRVRKFARSVVTCESPCSLGSQEMDPTFLKKEHMNLCGQTASVTSKVLSVYHLSGEVSARAEGPLSSLSSGSVHLEVSWREPKLEPPLLEAVSVMVIQAALGQSSSIMHPLWKQLWVLEKLLGILGQGQKNLRSVGKLPKYPSTNCTLKEGEDPAGHSVSEQLKMLFSGEFSSGIIGKNESGFASSMRASVLPSRTSMNQRQYSSKECKLKKSLEQVLSNSRINADTTDDLWRILSDCQYFNDIVIAFETIFREVKHGSWKPTIRHKNQSRTSAFLRAFLNADNRDTVDFTLMESSGVCTALEFLFDLGLEKLAHDYNYIFMESDLASREELLPLTFPRKSWGVSQEAWLSDCDKYLTWLIRMHASLESVLLAVDALTGNEQAFSAVTSQIVTFFLGVNSPIESANFISSNERCVTLRAPVNSQQIARLLSKPFELWQLTFRSENVETLFHRSTFQVFPPQILSGDSEDCIPEKEKSSYCNCKFITLLD